MYLKFGLTKPFLFGSVNLHNDAMSLDEVFNKSWSLSIEILNNSSWNFNERSILDTLVKPIKTAHLFWTCS